MFDWNEFRLLASAAAKPFCAEDHDLARLLDSTSPAREQTDEIGQPVPESIGIHQNTDIENFKRALRIRRELAQKEQQFRYISYADSVLRFLEATHENSTLFVVLIATGNATYEFLFIPESKGIFAEKVIV